MGESLEELGRPLRERLEQVREDRAHLEARLSETRAEEKAVEQALSALLGSSRPRRARKPSASADVVTEHLERVQREHPGVRPEELEARVKASVKRAGFSLSGFHAVWRGRMRPGLPGREEASS